MSALAILKYLHLLTTFIFTAAILAAHWNMLTARRAQTWTERAPLFELNKRLSLTFAIPALIGTGVLGQVLAMRMGFTMAGTRSFQLANGTWLVLLIVTLVLEMPAASKLAGLARSTARGNGGGEPVDYAAQLGRWRLGNALQLVLFLVMLGIMVGPWKV